MINLIKKLWIEWKSLKTWQQVCLILPFVLLTIGIILYIFWPLKSKNLEKELINHNKKAIDDHVETLEEQDKLLEKKQIKTKTDRIKLEKKIEEKEKDAESIIKKINAVDDNLDDLLAIHDELLSRRNSR